MTMKGLALAAVILGFSVTSDVAHATKAKHQRAGKVERLSFPPQVQTDSFAAMPSRASENTRAYHGGPKSND